MRESTLWLLILIKWCEMIFLWVLVGCLIPSCIALIQNLEGDAIYISVLAIISCLFALVHAVYNTLFTNLRFCFKLRCVTLGKCVYDFFNYLICFCCLR